MIVAMKHLDLICLASDGEATLAALRDLGAVHLDLSSAAGEKVAAAKGVEVEWSGGAQPQAKWEWRRNPGKALRAPWRTTVSSTPRR